MFFFFYQSLITAMRSIGIRYLVRIFSRASSLLFEEINLNLWILAFVQIKKKSEKLLL